MLDQYEKINNELTYAYYNVTDKQFEIIVGHLPAKVQGIVLVQVIGKLRFETVIDFGDKYNGYLYII